MNDTEFNAGLVAMRNLINETIEVVKSRGYKHFISSSKPNKEVLFHQMRFINEISRDLKKAIK